MVALEEAFRNQMMVGKFPACILNVSLNPDSIDVNVHPAKIEIRFSNEKPVYDAVYFAVKNSLMNHDRKIEEPLTAQTERKLTREEVFSKPAPQFSGTQLVFNSTVAEFNQVKKYEEVSPALNQRIEGSSSFEKYEADSVTDYDAEKLFDPDQKLDNNALSGFDTTNRFSEPIAEFKYINNSSFEKKEESKASEIVEEKPQINIRLVGEIFKTYIVCEIGNDVCLIDKHAAHERINFEKLKNRERVIDIQNLISPIEIALDYNEFNTISENLDLCELYGFIVEVMDAPRIAIKAVPVLISDDDPIDIILKLADIISENKNATGDELFDDLYHSIACKASIKANSLSSPEELLYLAKQVVSDDIRYCPHGRPVIVKLTKYEIEKMFKRIV